jgi:uncharacterized circularly permuted ATP-grasp superfamily protein
VLQEAIQRYHDLISDELGAETEARLTDQLRRRGLFFGGRALCTVLRPRFLLPEHYRYLMARAAAVLRAFHTAYHAALADQGVRAQFGLVDWEETLLAHAPALPDPSPLSRLDAFFSPESGELRFTEYNAETPAGTAYNDVMSEVFCALPPMRVFLRDYDVRPLPARHCVLHALLECHAHWAGRGETPRVAVLDWREVPTYSEFVLFKDYFRAQGVACEIVDPRELEYRGGRLVAGDFHITLLYKRVLLSELVAREGLDHAVMRAVRDGAVCMVNPFHCKILHKKASLAVLSDERNDALFSAEDREAIARHIPWTRRVEERRTVYDGQRVDLIPFVLGHRENLVLKSNDEYGGKGIVLGWETDQAAWERAVRAALEDPAVVQERVYVPREPYPTLSGGRVQVTDRMLDTDPFVFSGARVDGCLTRLSTAPLINVTAGGGSTVPTLLVEKR